MAPPLDEPRSTRRLVLQRLARAAQGKAEHIQFAEPFLKISHVLAEKRFCARFREFENSLFTLL